MRLVNRTDQRQAYTFDVVSPEGVTLEVIDEDAMKLDEGVSTFVPLSVRFPSSVTSGDGNEVVTVVIRDGDDNENTVTFRVLGPR